MARFVVAGKSNCPSYARIEALADRLCATLPNFKVNKIVIADAEWERWLQETCAKYGWRHTVSPLVWRELIDRGGKGLYMGGATEFEEYACHYYAVEPSTTSDVEARIAAENEQTLSKVRSEEERRSARVDERLVVCITRASSCLAYHLLAHVSSGRTFGRRPVELRLLDGDEAAPELEGIAMELSDTASPHLVGVVCTSSPQRAFAGAAVVFVLCPVDPSSCHAPPASAVVEDPTSPGGIAQSGAHHFESSVAAGRVFVHYAHVLSQVAVKDVRVLVCGGLVNMGVALMAKTAPTLNVAGSPVALEQRARSLVASRLRLNPSCVTCVAIWGRAEARRKENSREGEEEVVVDLTWCQVHGYQGAIVGPPPFSLPAEQCLLDPEWVRSTCSSLTAKGSSPSSPIPVMSEAAGISELMSCWMEGMGEGDHCFRSVILFSSPHLTLPDVPVDVAFSIPATCSSGHWIPAATTSLPPHLLSSIQRQGASLLEELQLVASKLVQ